MIAPRQMIQHHTDKNINTNPQLWKYKTKYYATFEKEMTDKKITG